MPNFVYVAPFRSVAAALILAIFFGPIGLFYSSLIGGVVMCAFALAGLGTVVVMNSALPMVTIWLFSILWAMIAVRFYNHRLLKTFVAHDTTRGSGAHPDVDKKKQSKKDRNPKQEKNAEQQENAAKSKPDGKQMPKKNIGPTLTNDAEDSPQWKL